MITGLDCRMTSLLLHHASRRGEQSNPQSTEANVLQSLGGTERHNHLCTPLCCGAGRAGRPKVREPIIELSRMYTESYCAYNSICFFKSSSDTRPAHFISFLAFTLERMHCWIGAQRKRECRMLRA